VLLRGVSDPSGGDVLIALYIALGGAAGALARFGLSSWVHSWGGTAFPWGTFAVNAVGSFLIGVLLRATEAAVAWPELRALLAIGLLGGFTTFSTFSYETAMLLSSGAWGRAALYSLGSVALGLAAVLAGIWVGGVAVRG
jgi:fluoride exporter